MAITRLAFASFLKLILISFLITSCESKPEVDVNQVQIDYNILRFEQDLFDSQQPMTKKAPDLHKKYGAFFERFCENILKLGSVEDPQLANNLKEFVYDSDIQKIQNKVQAKYQNIEAFSAELENGLKRYHHYFPSKVVPTVVTFVSGLNFAVAVTDSSLGIGLDMYMGPTFPYYEMVRFPQYRKNRLDEKYLVKDALMGWLQSEYEVDPSDKTFLNEIIFRGKLLYILQKLLPENSPENIIGYTKEQYQWCMDNETPMWGHFVTNKTFYSTLFQDYHKYINEGPFTPGFDRQSPDQTGYYVGWQIVKSYMANNPETSLQDLLDIKDPKIILNKSGYKPMK